MKKNKFYVFFILLITIFILSTAFIFNGCSTGAIKKIFNSAEQEESGKDDIEYEYDAEKPEFDDEKAVDSKDNGEKENKGKSKYFYRKPLKINFTISYDIKLLGKTEKIEFTTLVPDDCEYRQNVYETVYSITPDETFAVDSNKYVKFIIEPEDDFSINIFNEMQIFDYDLIEASRNQDYLNKEENSLSADNLGDYTKEENFIEKDNHQIQEISKNFIQENQIDLVREIYDFVLDYLKYTGYIPEDIGAVGTLKLKGGDCSCYSDLFVALCRACDIPARAVEGYTIDSRSISIGHDWVEVYLNDLGWIPFDPTFDDSNGNSSDSTFENLKNVYVYLSFIRNDESLNNYHFYAYNYWGDNVEVTKVIEVN